MKFQPESLDGGNIVTRHESGRIWVGAQAHTHALIVPWQGQVLDWQAQRFEDLSAAHFDRLLALEPEVVIFGSGARIRFPKPEWLRSLAQRRIGVETMDTAAACRTYNVLVTEGRSAVAAMLLGSA